MRDKIREDFSIVITTYGTMKRHLEFFSTVWSETSDLIDRTEGKWDYIILDEGHKIKNEQSEMSKCSQSLRVHHRIVLSGTPLQNNLVEMWNIMDWLCEHKLLGGRKEFV